MNKEDVDLFEKRRRAKMFSQVITLEEDQIGLINHVKEEYSSKSEVLNAGTLFRKKLVEMEKIFKKAGISMYSSVVRTPDEMLVSSVVGNAILFDLVDKCVDSTEAITKFCKIEADLYRKRSKQLQVYDNAGPIKKFIIRLKRLFVPVPDDFFFNEEERASLDEQLEKHKSFNEQISNYNLEDNLVPSLIKEIALQQQMDSDTGLPIYDKDVVRQFVEERIKPDLEKLKLGHLLPKLKIALVAEYEQSINRRQAINANLIRLNTSVSEFPTQTPNISTCPGQKQIDTDEQTIEK